MEFHPGEKPWGVKADVIMPSAMQNDVHGLGTGQGAAVGEALAGEHAILPHALEAAVLAVQIADLPAAHAHVAGGHVDVSWTTA